jgi:hypothetical protein
MSPSSTTDASTSNSLEQAIGHFESSDDVEVVLDGAKSLEDSKGVTYWQGVCLIISRQVGATILSVPSIVNKPAGSLKTSLLIWLGAGGVAYCGACK